MNLFNSIYTYYKTGSILIYLLLTVGIHSQSVVDSTFQSDGIYKTLVVQYGITDEGYAFQQLTFSHSSSNTDIIYLIRPEMSQNKRLRYFGKNAIVKECLFRERFDNRFLLQEIENWVQEGWRIKEHNFAMGKSASESSDRPRVSESEYISFFLFQKQLREIESGY